MSASTKVLLALRLGPTKAHVCRTCYSYSPKKKLKKTIPPSRQSLLGPRHPGSGAVTRHDLALPPPLPNRPKPPLSVARSLSCIGSEHLRRRPSRRLPASRGDFFFFLEIEIEICILLLCCVARVGFNFVRNPCDWENDRDRDQRFPENSMTFMPARKGWVTTPAYYLRDEQSASLRSPCLLRDDGTRPRWRSRPP